MREDSIGYELETACFVKPLGGLDEAQISFADQVLQWTTLPLELLGHTHHETEIGNNQLMLSALIAFLYPLRKLDFLLRYQGLVLADLSQVIT
jgi:hypothetical protein